MQMFHIYLNIKMLDKNKEKTIKLMGIREKKPNKGNNNIIKSKRGKKQLKN